MRLASELPGRAPGIALASLAALCPARAREADPAPPQVFLSAEQAREDLEILREAVEVIHPGLGRYAPASEFEEGWQAVLDRVADGTTDLELYLDVSLLLAGLRCGHTRVEAPEAVDAWRAEHATHLPFHFRLVEGRMFVEVGKALERGTEILRIDGRPVGELVEQLARTVPVDGWTDSIRPSRLQTAYEFQDSGFDHYLPYVDGFRERFELTLRAGNDPTTRVVTVAAIDSQEWAELAPDVGWSDFADAVAWRMESDDTALLEVGTFVNYRRPVDPEATFARVFGEIQDAGAEHLVLDLRSCGGGSSDVGWTLARFLIDRPIEVGGAQRLKSIRFGDLVPHLSTWVENAFTQPEEMFERTEDGWYTMRGQGPVTLTPHPRRFPGRITILVGPYNASGATMLLAKLQEAGTVRLVGEPTGGSAEGPTAGLIFFLTLPNSRVRVNVPVFRETTGVERFRPGRGVDPDVVTPTTVEDFLAGRDPALAEALREPR